MKLPKEIQPFAGVPRVTAVIMGTARFAFTEEVVGEDAPRIREAAVPTRGVVYVHASPLAVCPHVEWAISRVLNAPIRLDWTTQPVEPAARRAEFTWNSRPGTGAELAAALRQWSMIRFEVTEEPSPGVDGERFMHVPGRGLFHATASANGDILISEDRLRAIVAGARGYEALGHALERALGSAWDAELEPYRRAGETVATPLLTRVG